MRQTHQQPIIHRWFIACCIVWLSVFAAVTNAGAAAKSVPLPPDRAFVFSAVVSNPHEIRAIWKLPKGYFLYRDRIRVNVMPGIVNEIQFPQGQTRHSLEKGQYEVYSGKVVIPIHIQTDASQVEVRVDYQGCSISGFCYPPMHKAVRLSLPPSSGSQPVTMEKSYSELMTDQNSIAALLTTYSLGGTLLLFLVVGLMLAFTPCVLPMVPILTGLIVGQQKSVSTKKAFLLSLTYVLGMALTYALVGLLVASLGNSLQVILQKPVIIFFTSVLFVLLALSMFGWFHLQLSSSLSNRISAWSNRQQGGTYVGVFIMGILSTLVVSPCVTAPLVGVLIYIAQTGDKLLGASVLFTMGLGMGIPLLAIGVSAGKWLPKRGPWMEVVKKVFGLLMLSVAIWLMSRILPGVLTTLLWVGLLLGVMFFLGIYVPEVLGKRKFHRGLALAAGLVGLVLIGGEIRTMNAVHHWMGGDQMAQADTSFTVVHGLTELQKQLALARAADQPVIVDFYADWCESCVVMDKTVFNQVDLRQAMAGFVRLRVDLTANSAEDEALMRKYNVIAPPTMLFFNVGGKEILGKRIVGEMSGVELLRRIQVFVAEGCDRNVKC